MLHPRLLLPWLFAPAALLAQDFNFQPVIPPSSYCPREEVDMQKVLGTNEGRNYTNVHNEWVPVDRAKIIPLANRKPAGPFVAYDQKGKKVEVTAMKGKVIVFALFGLICDPSIRLAGEMAQLQAKAGQFGFEILPTHVDAWPKIRELVRRNAPHFDQAVFYKPGLGAEGLLNLGPEVTAIPTVVILDREGRVAWRWIGYHPGLLAKALRATLAETSTTEVKPTTIPQPTATIGK